MKGKRIVAIVCCLGSIGLFGQQDQYNRKSVTYLDAVILASPEARKMSINQIEFMRKTVEDKLHMARFDYNPIPASSKLMQSFLGQMKQDRDLTLDDISSILNDTFVPEIVQIIDEYAEKRASELVDDATKMSFITTKAKDLGITADNLEQVFNSGYIYLPFINGYSRSVEAKKNDKGVMKYTVTYSINGGIFWFKINYVDGKTAVVPAVKKETKSVGFAAKNSMDKSEQAAFKSAVMNYARNLENATKEFDEFKLSASIAEIAGSEVGFRMGRKEGLRIDDRFIVGEYIEQSNGERKFKSDGFMRIKSIADNRKNTGNLSHGYGVIVGDWAPGMSLIEHPRLNLDIYGFAGSLPLSTDTPSASAKSNFGIGAEIAYNLGQIIQQSHWYLTLGIGLGDARIEDNTWWTSATYNGSRLLAEMTILKRIQLHRFDVFARAGFAYNQVTYGWEDSNSDKYNDSNGAGGLMIGGGVNYAVDIDWTAGLRFSLYTGSSEDWTSDNTSIGDYTGINMKYSGAAIAFQVIYAPPSLPFDPAAILRNSISL